MKRNTYARHCSVTGAGMNEGYVIDEGMFYAATVQALEEILEREYGAEFSLDPEKRLHQLYDLHSSGLWYWTEWEE